MNNMFLFLYAVHALNYDPDFLINLEHEDMILRKQYNKCISVHPMIA